FTRLQPALIPTQNPQEFVSQRNETARNLAQTDALRLLLSFSRLLRTSNVVEPIPEPENPDRMLHVRAQGRKLGMFDLYYDSGAAEQVWAGQLKSVGGVSSRAFCRSKTSRLMDNRSSTYIIRPSTERSSPVVETILSPWFSLRRLGWDKRSNCTSSMVAMFSPRQVEDCSMSEREALGIRIGGWEWLITIWSSIIPPVGFWWPLASGLIPIRPRAPIRSLDNR